MIFTAETREDQLQSKHDELAPDAFFTPLLYSYNTPQVDSDNARLMITGDMPLLIQKEIHARAMPLKVAQHLFSECVEQWSNENLQFSPELRHKEVFVLPRVKYMAEVLR